MKRMTKLTALMLALTLALGLLTGCGGKTDSTDSEASDTSTSNADISTSGKKHAGTVEDPYPLTDALLKYKIWYETDNTV